MSANPERPSREEVHGAEKPVRTSPPSDWLATNLVFAPHALNSTRYFAWLYSPAPQCRLLEALLGLESEVAMSLRSGMDHDVAHTRLRWWREECERCAAGFPVHPLTREINAVVPLASGLSGFVDTATWDLAKATFDSRSDLESYCQRWSQALFGPMAMLVSQPHASQSTETTQANPAQANHAAHASQSTEATQRVGSPSGMAEEWQNIGVALRELELLMNLYGEARAGRLRIPLDELERVGADPADVLRLPWSAPIGEILRQRHESLRASLSRSLGALTPPLPERLPPQSSALRGLLVWTALAWQTSQRAQRQLPNVFRASRFEPLADSWRAWRAARRSAAGGSVLATTG